MASPPAINMHKHAIAIPIQISSRPLYAVLSGVLELLENVGPLNDPESVVSSEIDHLYCFSKMAEIHKLI